MVLDSFAILSILKELGSEHERKRVEAELESHDIFEGALHLKITEKLKKIYPKTWECYNVADYNILKKITEKKSKSYVKPPARQLDQEGETELYNSILNEFSFNDAMKLMDRYRNQHKYCAIGVIRERNPITSKDKFNFWALAPYEFSVHRDPKDEIYAWSIPTGEDSDGLHHWTLWTKDSHLKIKTKDYEAFEIVPIAGNEKMVNPYGIIPFVYVPLDMGGKYPYPSSLPRQTIEVNTNLSIYLTSGNMQIGQLVLKHPKNQKIDWVVNGLMTAMKLEQEIKEGAPSTEAEYISPSPNLEGHKDSILTFMQLILDEHGINSNSLIKQGETFTSGFDRLLASADVQDIIEDNQDMYTRVENEVYKIIKAMHERDGVFTFKSDRLKVKFARPKVLSSDTEKLDNLKKKKELGLWEEWQLLQDADPNLTEEEAKKIIEERTAAKALDAKNVFNGAQVTSLVAVVTAVTTEQMPVESGVQILISSFGMTEDQARKILPNNIETNKPDPEPSFGRF
jgi:hypothetical protein